MTTEIGMTIATIIITIKDKTEIITQKDHVTIAENSDILQGIAEKVKIIKIIITIETIVNKLMKTLK
jgi:hypothetical protein